MSRLIDVLTVCFLLLTGYLVLRPGGILRVEWDQHRMKVTRQAVLERNWSQMQQASLTFLPGTEPELLEFSDYQCPACRATDPAVDSVLKRGVSVGYLNYVVRPDPSKGAALATLCASQAGRFASFHKRLMTTSAWQKDTNWTREAWEAGIVDTVAFALCMRSPATEHRLAVQRAFADSIRASGTPTFVTRRTVRIGSASESELLALRGK